MAPWRLESRLLSGPRISGRCAKMGSSCAQRPVLQHLLRCVGEVVRSPDDVGETHIEIVGDHAEMIGGDAVGAEQHEVLQLGVDELYPAEDGIIKRSYASVGDGKRIAQASPASFRLMPPQGRVRGSAGHTWASGLRPRLRAAAAPALPWCRSRSKRGRCGGAPPAVA